MKKAIAILPIIFLILFTTYIKGTTKKIEREIFNIKEELRVLQNNYDLVLLEYNYLTSPEKLFDYQKKYFEKELVILNIENISSIKLKKKELYINKIIKKNENRK
tara:strand:+ start:937 stop:1251 length:315 start_codon:yes stop_codon:yes gene_type:complete